VHTIEKRFGERTLAVAELAVELGISHNHLTRLFRRTFDKTAVAYIRERRMGLAKHLLLNTNLPIKSIAYQVGIPDLHLFNKTVHRELGASPRVFRKRHMAP